MATLVDELLLSLDPEETVVFAVGSEWPARGELATGAASASERGLGRTTILLSEVRGLKHGVMLGRTELLELQAVDTSGGGEATEDERSEEVDEQHGWWWWREGELRGR